MISNRYEILSIKMQQRRAQATYEQCTGGLSESILLKLKKDNWFSIQNLPACRYCPNSGQIGSDEITITGWISNNYGELGLA